jgi:hypothetical protein
MRGQDPHSGPYASTVRVTSMPRPVVRAQNARRINAWFVRSIMLATTVFAIVDLSLLISSLHH